MNKLSHEHVLERIKPDNLSVHQRVRRAEQISYAMAWVQDYYMHELGLVRVDKDNPPASKKDIDWRLGRVSSSGPLEETGLEYILARRVDPNFNRLPQRPSEVVSGVCGLVALSKNTRCPDNGSHTRTELVEFDIRQGERSAGLGSSLLKFALETVHPEDELFLEVAEPNHTAQNYYSQLGFEFTHKDPKYYGVFAYKDGTAMPHLSMAAPANIVQGNLAGRLI